MKKQLVFLFSPFAVLAVLTGSILAYQMSGRAAVLETPTERPQQADQPKTITTPTQAPQCCTVDTGTPAGQLNVRACPGTGCEVVDVLTEGELLQVIGMADGWQEIKSEAGAIGFVNSKYCKKIGE